MRPWREGGTSLAEMARALKMGFGGHCQRVGISEIYSWCGDRLAVVGREGPIFAGLEFGGFLMYPIG